MQLLIYIIYDDGTTIGFVGFVANVLNRPTEGATASVRKRVTFRALVSTFSLRVQDTFLQTLKEKNFMGRLVFKERSRSSLECFFALC
jgi:hypothetical protein